MEKSRHRMAAINPLKLSLFCLFILTPATDGSPMEEMMIRVDQYKEKTLAAPGCGFWREVLRLHHKVLKKLPPPKSPPGTRLL